MGLSLSLNEKGMDSLFDLISLILVIIGFMLFLSFLMATYGDMMESEEIEQNVQSLMLFSSHLIENYLGESPGVLKVERLEYFSNNSDEIPSFFFYFRIEVSGNGMVWIIEKGVKNGRPVTMQLPVIIEFDELLQVPGQMIVEVVP
jgi:hypothetical protein